MKLYDYFKKLFGGGSDNVSADIEGLEDYVEELKRQKQTTSQPQTPNYERKEPVVKTDEEIEQEAKKELEDYFSSNERDISDEYDSNLLKQRRAKENHTAGLQNSLEKVRADYREAAQNADNDSIRKGVARSSIAEKKIEDLDRKRNVQESALNENYREKLREIDDRVAALKKKRDKALNDLNVSYSSKLKEKIDKLTKERQKTLDEALEYNNRIAEQEYKDKLEAQKNSGNFTPDSDFYERVYTKADELLSQMSASRARSAVFGNEYLKKNLNDYYYYKLYKKYV